MLVRFRRAQTVSNLLETALWPRWSRAWASGYRHAA